MANSLADEIAGAARQAFTQLLKNGERFYYCTLVTTGEAHAPQVSAWSHEALERTVAEKSNPDMWRSMIKWSYADSPYVDFGSEYFENVRTAFDARPPMKYDGNPADWDKEYNYRLDAITDAMLQLSNEGLFGEGTSRHSIIVLAEVAPPDSSNAERARKLNPPGPALDAWMEEAAEPDE